MGDRTLRSGTRKDYRQMIEGDDFLSENNGEVSDAYEYEYDSRVSSDNGDSHHKAIKHKSGSDVRSEPEDSLEEDAKECAESDSEEVKRVEERLLRLRKEEKELKKKEKLKRLEQETKEVERSLKRLKDGGEARTEKVNTGTLRKMPEVVDEVDKLMDRKFNLKGVQRKSRSSRKVLESDRSSSASDSEETSDSGDERKKRSKSKRRSSKSGRHRSGKSKKVTSYVKFPQKWPHSQLGQHLILREKKYDDLTMAEFCVGELSILEGEDCSDRERVKRLSHLKDIMYLGTKYQWKYVLNYHAACLLEVERGVKKWGSKFERLQSTTLAGGLLQQGSGSNGGGRFNNGGQQGRNEGAVYCKYYQRGTCNQPNDHMGQFNGENRLLKHMCARCYVKNRKVESHPESYDSCPSK
jgi:hypothetical protein